VSPVNNCITHREIAICDFPIRQIACGPLWRTGGRWRKASSENRESEFRESREQVHQKSRNRDMRFPDKADSVWATLEDRWQVKGPSEDQRIGNRQIGIPVNEGSGKSLKETPTRNLSRPSEEGHVSRDRAYQRSETPGIGTCRSRNPRKIKSRPSGRTRGKGSGVVGTLSIGKSEIPVTRDLCIVKSRSVKPRSVGNNCQHSREGGQRRSGEQLSA
jgi:hypothetical protein